MAEDVIIRYRAEVDELTQKVNAVISQQEKLAATQNKTQKELNQTTTSVKKLETELSNTGQSFKKAEAGAKGFGQTVSKEIKPLGGVASNIGLQIAGAFAAAFSVQAVIAFGKASIDAFLEAEENANKLRFAITQIGQDSEAAFGKLIEQSERLQKATIFSDDAIQQAQAALATFGLTADQIEELIPKLADFASATKTDIVSAANQVGAGLQGMGREFKRVGIEVSASQTPLENYQNILQGFEKFAGASADELETLNGQLKQQANIAGELQEEIGSKLAGAFVNARVKVLQFFSTMIDGLRSVQSLSAESFSQNIADRQVAIVAEIEAGIESLVRSGVAQDKASELVINRLRERLEREIEQKSGITEFFNQVTVLKQELAALNNYNDALAVTNERQKNLLTAELLRGKSLNELNKLLEQNKKLNDVQSQSNVQLIEDEIKVRKKLAEQAQREAEELTKKEAAELQKRKDEVRDWVNDVARFLNDARLKKTIEAKVEFTEDFENDLNELNKARVESDETDQKRQDFNRERTLQKEQELNDAILASTEQTVSAIAGFYSDFLDGRITQVDEQLNAELSAIDAQEQALNNSLDKRIISQSEFTKQQEILQNKRLEAEKKADKETRKLKRQQLIIDKTTALIEIGLDLQKAIAAYSANPITATLLPVIAGVITAALAAVSAVSIPAFKKGTKGKKGSGLSLVGEEGPELTYLPTGAKVVPARQTKAYSELIDAMYDNNVDKYILKQYVAPRLEAQRRQFQDAKDQTFVKNIVNNMSYNGLSLSDQLYANSRGVAIKDKKELAEMVGKAVAENIPRPDPWRM